MNDQMMILATLVARAGGRVEISPHELQKFMRPTMRQYMDAPDRGGCLVIEVQMPMGPVINGECRVVER